MMSLNRIKNFKKVKRVGKSINFKKSKIGENCGKHGGGYNMLGREKWTSLRLQQVQTRSVQISLYENTTKTKQEKWFMDSENETRHHETLKSVVMKKLSPRNGITQTFKQNC